MDRKPKVTVVGSCNIDLVVRAPRIPAAGETILGGPFFTGPGGKGANQAIGAARLGADVTFVAKLGRDAFGDQAAANLEREGVRLDYVQRTAKAATGVAFIVVDDAGENTIIVASGANAQLTSADVDSAGPALVGADVALFQLESPLATVIHAASMARAAGVKVVLNPAPGRRLEAELLATVDVLTPNETEMQLITEMPVETLTQIELAARTLLVQGVKTVVVTLGAKGALAVTQAGARYVPAYKVEVVDTTGAGDAFNAALAAALAESQPLVDAVAFANAAAALQVTKNGATPAMPRRAEVEALMGKQNI